MSAPEIVHRYYFSKGEVIAALFANSPACEFTDVAVVGDEVIVEFAGPKNDPVDAGEMQDKTEVPPPEAPPEDKQAPSAPDETMPPPERPKGRIEQEALALCEDNLFRIFCQERGGSDPVEFVREKCRVADLAMLDAGSSQKYAVSRFRDLSADFDVWARGD